MDHDHGGMASGGSSSSQVMNNSHQMQMTFYWSKNLTLLFSGWVTSNGLHYGLTLLAVVCFALLHQFLSYRVYRSGAQTEDESLTKQGTSRTGPLHLLLGLFSYAAYTSTSFILMLMVMSFNVGVFIAVVVGLTLGTLLFPKKSSRKSLLAESSTSPQSTG